MTIEETDTKSKWNQGKSSNDRLHESLCISFSARMNMDYGSYYLALVQMRMEIDPLSNSSDRKIMENEIKKCEGVVSSLSNRPTYVSIGLMGTFTKAEILFRRIAQKANLLYPEEANEGI